MTVFAFAICVTLLVLIVMQAVPALAFIGALRRVRPPLPTDGECPKAAVLLSVRGDDPFLAQCVEGLLQQDYPRYSVRIVVDHVEDPAWDVIDRVVKKHPGSPVRVEPLAERLGTCTLKANSLLQAVNGLDESHDVVAVLDADVLPHRTWLRELVGPFRDDRVAATTGCRWYMPARATLASLARYAWNAGAAVQLYFNHGTWGGSMAIRARLFRQTDLRDRWRHAVASDTALDGVLRKTGGKVAFVPVVSINRESCTLRILWRFLRRQFLHVRLEGSGWPLIVLHAAATTGTLLAGAASLLVACAEGRPTPAVLAGGGLAAYGTAMLALLGCLEAAVRKAVAGRDEKTRWLTPGVILKMLLAAPVAQIVYATVIPTVGFLKDVTWRGVAYRIEGRGVRLVHYEPYRRKERPDRGTHSL